MELSSIKRFLRYVLHGIPEKHIEVSVKQYTQKRLNGKNILITGGGRGIGFYIAKKCIDEGGTVLICGRNLDSLKKASAELGSSCHYIQYDIAMGNYRDFIEKAFGLLNGRIDCLVNNAGISYHEGSFFNVTEQGFDEQFNVNYKGCYFLSRYYIEKVKSNKQESANILFITSERGSFCTEIPYGLSKASVKSLVGSLSRNLYGRDNIRVNALAPGVTASDMTGHDINGNYYSETSPIQRVFHPAEIANVACFLLSDESSCISGETVHCDAGHHQNVIN